MKKRHWDSLVVSLRHGQCVLVLGPELPAERVPPEGTEPPDPLEEIAVCDALREHLASQLADEKQLYSGNNLPAIAQQYEDYRVFGAGALRSSTAQFYDAESFRPSRFHRALAQLPFSLVISTCHKSLLAEAFGALDPPRTPLVHWYNFRGDRRDNREMTIPGVPNTPVIYHLFGHSSDPTSLALSENDLLDFLAAVVSSRPPLPNSLRTALRRPGQTFLFVGFGIRHWYLRLLLKVLVRALDLNQSGDSFALEPALLWEHGDRDQTVLFYQRGTRVEIIDVPIDEFLKNLTDLFQKAGGYSGRMATVVRPRVFISYEHNDSELASRLFAALQRADFEPWLDKEGLRAGQEWNQEIENNLSSCDYVVLLQSPELVNKRVGYVNREISFALDRSKEFRNTVFLIPLLLNGLAPERGIDEVRHLEQKPLRDESFDADVAEIARTIKRDFQLRARK